MNGCKIMINEGNCLNLGDLARILENDEILNWVIDFQHAKEVLIMSNCMFEIGDEDKI
jgi:hypothetical protein